MSIQIKSVEVRPAAFGNLFTAKTDPHTLAHRIPRSGRDDHQILLSCRTYISERSRSRTFACECARQRRWRSRSVFVRHVRQHQKLLALCAASRNSARPPAPSTTAICIFYNLICTSFTSTHRHARHSKLPGVLSALPRRTAK